MTGKNCIVVIGGSGFVGSRLIPKLLAQRFEVYVVNRGNCLMAGAIQVIADRNNVVALTDASRRLPPRVWAVIDTSCYNGVQSRDALSAFGSRANLWIHLSSAAVYDPTPGRAPCESDRIGGATAWGDYGRGKSDADLLLLENEEIPNFAILRPPYLYGPGNRLDRETFVWSRCLQGRPVFVPGDGKTLIQFLHIDDLVATIVKIVQRGPLTGRIVYNIAAPEPINFADYVAKLAEIIGSANPTLCVGEAFPEFNARQYFPFRDYPCLVDVTKITNECEWRAEYDLQVGFQQTLGLLQLDALRSRPIGNEVEEVMLKELGESWRGRTDD